MPVENAVAKALRQAGFPEIEAQVNPSSLANKFMGSLQKRILKMDDLVGKCKEAPSTEMVGKTLFFYMMTCQLLFLAVGSCKVYEPEAFCCSAPGLAVRMCAKLTELKEKLERVQETLTNLYGEGVLNGFPQELLASTNKGLKGCKASSALLCFR